MRKLLVVAMLAAAMLFLGGAISFAQQHGSISGMVTDQATSEPIFRAAVRAYLVDGPYWPVAQTATDSAGQYELNVPFGTFHVEAHKWGYLPEWWQEAATREDATPVVVDQDNSPTGINFTLAEFATDSGSIAGTVTDFDTNLPLEAANVVLRRSNDYHFHRMMQTLADGSYLFDNLPPGTYLLECFKEGYVPAEYPDPVVVNGNDVTGIDFVLHPLVLGSIAGTVTDASTGSPLAEAMVIARLAGNFWVHRVAFTGTDGTYLIEDVPPGEFRVSCDKRGYVRDEYDSLIAVNGDAVTGIDFALQPLVFGGISGIVTDANTNEPIQGAIVVAVAIGMPHYMNWARTDSGGFYSMVLLSGEYRVESWAFGYLREVYDDTVVVDDEVVPNIDFALVSVEFGSISGTVYDADSIPIAGAFVHAHMDHGWWRSHARTDSMGNYTIDHLLAGAYHVRAFAYGYTPQVYPTLVEVDNGEDVTGIDFYLSEFDNEFDGHIAGNVFDESTNQPIAEALLVAVGQLPFHRPIVRYVHSNEQGNYLFENLPTVGFKIFCSKDGFVPEFYDNKTSWRDADIVTPDADNINIGLAPVDGGGIRLLSGQVTLDGLPVAGAVVHVLQDGEVAALGATYPDGNYYVVLAPGEYDVEVIGPTGEEAALEMVSLVYADYYDANLVLSPTSIDDETILPAELSLKQNYPNPFNASTSISFFLVSDGQVELVVYDMLGRRVKTLQSGFMSAGEHTVVWNGADSDSKVAVSGLYLYVLRTAEQTLSKRMMLLK